MSELAPAKRRPSRVGIGVLMLIFGAISLVTLFRPSPGMMEPDNGVQFATMLLVGVALALGGVAIMVSGFQRR
jgi:predicted phage tail protein